MATIIKKTPDQNGAFGNQSWPEACPAPEGYAVIPEAFGPVWEQHKPFVSVTFRDDVITGMADNPEGRAAQAVIDNDIGPLQAAKQAQNNAAFAAFLAAHPIPFTDGKLYGVTLSDQNEIALNLTLYQTAAAAGLPAVLEWHAVHEECVPWTVADLTQLLLMIGGFVYPYYHQNQTIKVAIYAATTLEELDAIEIDYAVTSG